VAFLEARAHRNVVIVAVAHKLARVTWAVLSSGSTIALPQWQRKHRRKELSPEVCKGETTDERTVKRRR